MVDQSSLACRALLVPRVPNDMSAAMPQPRRSRTVALVDTVGWCFMAFEARRCIASLASEVQAVALRSARNFSTLFKRHGASRTSCCESQRRLLAMPNVGGELTAQARRLGREAENRQSRRTAKVPCRSGSARPTG